MKLLTTGADEVGTVATACDGGARFTLLMAPPVNTFLQLSVTVKKTFIYECSLFNSRH